MTEEGSEKRRAAVLLLVAVALAGLMAVVSAGVQLFADSTSYRVEFGDSVAGLSPASEVRYLGVPVGEVSGIDIAEGDGDRVEVLVRVRADVPVSRGARARLVAAGITGSYYLELYGGSRAAGRLPAGGVIPGDATATLGSLTTSLASLSERVDQLLARNEEALSEAVRRATQVLAAGETAVEEATRTIQTTRQEVGATAKALRAAVGDLRAILRDPALRGLPRQTAALVEHADQALARVPWQDLGREALGALRDLRGLATTLERAADSLEATAAAGRREVPGALRDARQAAADLRAAARRLRRDPSVLLRGGGGATPTEFPDPLPSAEPP
ncbi:MAG: MlaD family protein [Planctomycetota bacterium]